MSTTTNETELTVYARLEDPEDLEQAAEMIEDHIQLESTLISGARQRVRKITPVKGGAVASGDRFEFTIKKKLPKDAGVPSSLETTQETDRNFYEAYSEVATRGVVKRRFVIIGGKPKIDGLSEDIVLPAIKYEIDQFTNPNTKQKSEWIKIDIELDDILKALSDQGIDTSKVKQKFNLKSLPFTMEDMFSPENMNEQQKAKLDELWKKEFSMAICPDEYTKDNDNNNPAIAEKPQPQPEPDQSPSLDNQDGSTEDNPGERNNNEE